jgi:hypothetical protein
MHNIPFQSQSQHQHHLIITRISTSSHHPILTFSHHPSTGGPVELREDDGEYAPNDYSKLPTHSK